MNLSDKVIVITGAASGMGEACAHLFAQQGARVVLADRDQARAGMWRPPSKKAVAFAEFIAIDVADEKSIQAMVDLAVGKFGGLDGAVNGAGFAGTPAPVVDQPASEWRMNFDVMLLGVVLCMKYEIAAMMRRGADR